MAVRRLIVRDTTGATHTVVNVSLNTHVKDMKTLCSAECGSDWVITSEQSGPSCPACLLEQEKQRQEVP